METQKYPYLGVQTLHRQAQALQLLVDKTHDGLRQKSEGLGTIWDPHASFSPGVTEGLPHHPAPSRHGVRPVPSLITLNHHRQVGDGSGKL